MKSTPLGKFMLLLAACILSAASALYSQTIVYQSGFEPADPAFLYRAGSVNTPVLSTTGGNTGPYCGKFTTNGKYDGAFVTGTTVNFTLNKYYTVAFSYKVATCAGSLSIYQ